MAAPSYISLTKTSAGTIDQASMVANLIAYQTNDLLFLDVNSWSSSGGAVMQASGWTFLDAGQSGGGAANERRTILYRRMLSSDSSSTVTVGPDAGTAYMVTRCFGYRPAVGEVIAFGASSSKSSLLGDTLPFAVVTLNALALVGCFMDEESFTSIANFTNNTGFTERAESFDKINAQDMGACLLDKSVVAAGTSTSIDGTWNFGSNWRITLLEMYGTAAPSTDILLPMMALGGR